MDTRRVDGGPVETAGSGRDRDLHALARALREHPALLAKAGIGLVGEVLGEHSWVHGPGDDGAVVPEPAAGGAGAGGHVVACGEALRPEFVAADPYGAGLAAVLANVNDLAAMGAVPAGIVDTVVAPGPVARDALRGLRDGCRMYDVPLLGGHLTVHDGPPALSAYGTGFARRLLSVTHAAAGQALVVAACTEGEMRRDFPFFRSFAERGDRLAGDVRLLAALAEEGTVVAAKDVSMAGLVGSLAMLLEWGRLGATVDLASMPRPDGVPLLDWLTCFPAYGFLLTTPPDRASACVAAFARRGIAAAVVGELDPTGRLTLREGGEAATVLDLSTDPVTGLRR